MTRAERYKRQPAGRNLPAIEVLQNAETKSDVRKKVFATWNNGYNCEMFGIVITCVYNVEQFAGSNKSNYRTHNLTNFINYLL